MRFLTAASAIILAIAGAFGFAFSEYGFAGVAFAFGVALIAEAFCNLASYCISFRKHLLPDTVLVEGVISGVLGFAVVSDLVPDENLSLLFGAWFMMSGVTRFSQSFAVSRVNPRNWFAVLPFGMINALGGFVIMVPKMLTILNLSNVYAISAAFVLNAFSIMIYCIYMINKKTASAKAVQAKLRAEAKQKKAEEKRKERNMLRNLTEAERESIISKAKADKQAAIQEKKEEKQAKREADRIKRRPASERTMQFADSEVNEIKRLSSAVASEPETDASEPLAVFDDGMIAAILEQQEADARKAVEEEARKAKEEQLRQTEPAPVWNKPSHIPVIEKNITEHNKPVSEKVDFKSKREIVNLEKIESDTPPVSFEKIQLPEFELKSEGGESRKRKSILQELEREKVEDNAAEGLAGFAPLTLEELFADEKFNIKPLSDPKATQTDLKLTQTFTFDWLNKKM